MYSTGDPDGGLGMFSDPLRGEAMKRGDVLSQIGSDRALERAPYQRDLDFHRHGEPQLRALAIGARRHQPRFGKA